MIKDEELFDFFSDSHFMDCYDIGFQEINFLIYQLRQLLSTDNQYQQLRMAHSELEDAINNRVADLINDLLTQRCKNNPRPTLTTETAVKPLVEVRSSDYIT